MIRYFIASIAILQFLFMSHVNADESCSEVEISLENLQVLEISQSQIIKRDEKIYAVVCFIINAPINIGRVSGGGCGGSGKCGGNFLVLDKWVFPIRDPVDYPSNVEVWHRFSLNEFKGKRLSIAKNVEIAKGLISEREEGEIIIMAPQLEVGIDSFLKTELADPNIRLGTSLNPDTIKHLNEADSLKLLLEDMDGAKLINIQSLPAINY
ncbi:hypothetical protein [Rheinheimera gaetbuli]